MTCLVMTGITVVVANTKSLISDKIYSLVQCLVYLGVYNLSLQLLWNHVYADLPNQVHL
jgi:hypothetical protein